MSKLGKSLRTSIEAEKNNFEQKSLSIEEKIKKAEEVFGHHNEEKNNVKSDIVKKDTFSFPEDDYALLEKIKSKLLKHSHVLNKSEIVRLGLIILNEYPELDLVKEISKIRKIKVGRK